MFWGREGGAMCAEKVLDVVLKIIPKIVAGDCAEDCFGRLS